MNIWLINHYAVPPKYYPLARQTFFAKYMMKKGHSVTIFAASTVHNSDINLITDKSLFREETVDGVSYVYIRCHSYDNNGLKRVYNICEFANKLSKVCAKFRKPDAIVATSMPPTSCAVGIKLAKKYNAISIAEIADLWPESLIAYGITGPQNPITIVLRFLEKWIYKKADAIVFTMEGAYDYIIERNWSNKIPKDKVYYINNGVDLESFQYNRDNFRIKDEDLENNEIFKVIYAGSIRKVNNVGILLDVAKNIKNKKVKILIWGGGDELEILRNRVFHEKIDNVELKGKVDKKYIPYIVSKADLNIAHNTPTPLFRFGISFNKLFDYLAAGKPVLSDFPCPYNPAVMFGAGEEVSDSTVENISQAIDNFSELDRLKYEKYCQNAIKAAHAYDFSVLTEKLLKIIMQMNKNKRRD